MARKAKWLKYDNISGKTRLDQSRMTTILLAGCLVPRFSLGKLWHHTILRISVTHIMSKAVSLNRLFAKIAKITGNLIGRAPSVILSDSRWQKLVEIKLSHRRIRDWKSVIYISGSDRTNVCWVKEGCSSLKPAACSTLPLEVVDHVDDFEDPEKLNLHLNTGCYNGDVKNLNAQLNNAPASCNPPCFRIKKPGKYCYMGTRNNNFSNRRHIGVIEVVSPTPSAWFNVTFKMWFNSLWSAQYIL